QKRSGAHTSAASVLPKNRSRPIARVRATTSKLVYAEFCPVARILDRRKQEGHRASPNTCGACPGLGFCARKHVAGPETLWALNRAERVVTLAEQFNGLEGDLGTGENLVEGNWTWLFAAHRCNERFQFPPMTLVLPQPTLFHSPSA